MHRDLKPENILVTQDDIDKITDWGLASLAEKAGDDISISGDLENGERQSLIRRGKIVGTPPYMAPEQWRGEEADVRTDIYAVGCILFEVLTGRMPFHANFAEGFEHAHLRAAVPSLPCSMPAELNSIVRDCLIKKKNERIASPSELTEVLKALYLQYCGDTLRTLRTGEEFDASDHSNRAVTYAALGQVRSAFSDFDQAIVLRPNDAILYNNRANNFSRLGQYERAIADYDRAIALKPDFGEAYNNRGITYGNLGRFKLALYDFNLSIALEPNDAEVYNNRGYAHSQLGQPECALADYDKAIALEPDLTNAHVNKSELLSKSS